MHIYLCIIHTCHHSVFFLSSAYFFIVEEQKNSKLIWSLIDIGLLNNTGKVKAIESPRLLNTLPSNLPTTRNVRWWCQDKIFKMFIAANFKFAESYLTPVLSCLHCFLAVGEGCGSGCKREGCNTALTQNLPNLNCPLLYVQRTALMLKRCRRGTSKFSRT